MVQHSKEEKMQAFGRLSDVLDELRIKCPWDRKQTNESLRPNTIEEVYELCDALERDDAEDICKELGDVLLHVCFYAKIASEEGRFDIADVCAKLVDKLIFRHPHIYGNVQAKTAGDVADNWEKIKQREKGGNATVLAGIPRALPSLIKAFRVQEKTAHVGFDWGGKEQAWTKVREGLAAFVSSAADNARADGEEKFGEVLFALVNAARMCGINPDNALEHANRKFISRFNYLEQEAKATGRSLETLSQRELETKP